MANGTVFNNVAAELVRQCHYATNSVEGSDDAYMTLNHWSIEHLVEYTNKAHKAALLLRKMYEDEISIEEAEKALKALV